MSSDGLLYHLGAGVRRYWAAGDDYGYHIAHIYGVTAKAGQLGDVVSQPIGHLALLLLPPAKDFVGQRWRFLCAVNDVATDLASIRYRQEMAALR
jgi:hypothetical protein